MVIGPTPHISEPPGGKCRRLIPACFLASIAGWLMPIPPSESPTRTYPRTPVPWRSCRLLSGRSHQVWSVALIAIVPPYESGGDNPSKLAPNSRFCDYLHATGICDGESAAACGCGSGYTVHQIVAELQDNGSCTPRSPECEGQAHRYDESPRPPIHRRRRRRTQSGR